MVDGGGAAQEGLSDRRELHALGVALEQRRAQFLSSSAMLREIAGCASPRWRAAARTPPRSATARKSRSAFSFMVRVMQI